MNPFPRHVLAASMLLLWLLAVSFAKKAAAQQRQPPQAPRQPFDIDFRPALSPAPGAGESPSGRPSNDAVAKAYHILGMPLNAFLQAMAQRAGVNYIPTPDVQGTVGSVFYDLDPVSMAKAGARVNGYQLESLDGVFVVHRVPTATESQPPQSAFRQRKSGRESSPPFPPVAPQPSTPPDSASRNEAAHARPPKRQAGAVVIHPHPPKKIPVASPSSVSAEDKKLIALAKKLALQKEEQKELLEQERRLHRRLQEEERALGLRRKATEKALREQLVRAKKAAEQAQRSPPVE